jgi:hypothetical protein
VSRRIARGWATVDLDRARAQLAPLLHADAAFEPVARSVVLGARCVRGRAAADDEGAWIIVLEPDTEGRVAASLARHGEGWMATWVAAAASDPPRVAATTTPGPLGPESLEPGAARAGPFRLRVSPATIET